MVARNIQVPAPFTLTQENHPENAIEAEKPPTVSLFAMVGISALCGVVGMTLGAAALWTAFLADGSWEALTLVPLVVALVCFASGWTGAFFWMCREEASKKESSQG